MDTKNKNKAGKKEKRMFCYHDYKNAIQIGNVDYVCPKCKNLLDPLEWFFMNSFEFIDATPKKVKPIKKMPALRKKKVLKK